MPTAYFLAPYKRQPGEARPSRYVIVNDLTRQIWADNGWPAGNVPGSPEFWSETEVLGQHAIVKVRASAAMLTSVGALAGVTRLPVDRLDDPLSSLTNPQKTALRNRVLALGYTAAEIDAALPNNLGTYTLRDVLGFIATRRRKVRYDAGTDTIIDDGPVQPVRPLGEVDAAVV